MEKTSEHGMKQFSLHCADGVSIRRSIIPSNQFLLLSNIILCIVQYAGQIGALCENYVLPIPDRLKSRPGI